MRRVLTGMRDCEFRLDVGGDFFGVCDSGAGEIVDTCIPKALEVAGFEVVPLKSLCALRCRPMGLEAGARSVCTASNDGATPKYHAVGDEGDIPESGSLGNIGFGLCILPSEPLRLRRAGIPYPGSGELVLTDKTSPNKRGRNGSVDGKN